MDLNLSVDDVLTTTRSVRKRLDFDRPVERSVVEECLHIATQAPTAGNRQGWQWVFVEDAAKRKALGEIYARNFFTRINAAGPEDASADKEADRQKRGRESSIYLAENFHRAPVLLVPCIAGRLDGVTAFAGASSWGSLLPAVWSFMLAARERGLGSAWTTLHLTDGGEQEAAEILGIPYESYTQAGLFPIAYTVGTDFKRASRVSLNEIVHWDAW